MAVPLRIFGEHSLLRDILRPMMTYHYAPIQILLNYRTINWTILF